MLLRAIAVAACLGLGACKKKAEAPPAQQAQERTTPLPADTPMNLAKPDEARVRLDLTAAREAVRLYQQEHDGKSPDGLGALGLHLDYPDDIVYSGATGIVRSKTYPMY